MLVAYWSPSYREETAQILTLVGGMCCREFPCNVVGVENYLHTHNLGYHLLGSRYDSVRRGARRGSDVYYKAGELFVRHVCSEMGRTNRFGSVIRADENGMYFLPMDQSMHEDSYRFVVQEALEQQIELLESRFDEVYINLQSNENDTTLAMLERAEVVVVCLPATVECFDEFYSLYRSMIDKCFFVFFSNGELSAPMKQKIRQYLPKHTTRCCHMIMTRILRNYLSNGRGLDYLDRFRIFVREEDTFSAGVAETEERYQSLFAKGESDTADYRNWKNLTDRHFGDEAIGAALYGEAKPEESERSTIRTLRYICRWLIKYEYREAGDDCVQITERMVRRKMIPREVVSWQSANS